MADEYGPVLFITADLGSYVSVKNFASHRPSPTYDNILYIYSVLNVLMFLKYVA
jgi:hypothetical protein